MSEPLLVSDSKAQCEQWAYNPLEPERVSYSGQEINIKELKEKLGKKGYKKEVIKRLLDIGVSEDCIVQSIGSWWKVKDPGGYFRAIKSQLQRDQAKEKVEQVEEPLKIEKPQQQEEQQPEEQTEGEEAITPTPAEKPQIEIRITDKMVGYLYMSALSIPVMVLNVKYKKNYKVTDIIPEQDIFERGSIFYEVLKESGLLENETIKKIILFGSLGGAVTIDIGRIINAYKIDEEEQKKEEEGNKKLPSDLELYQAYQQAYQRGV
jgi:hypothetical protein